MMYCSLCNSQYRKPSGTKGICINCFNEFKPLNFWGFVPDEYTYYKIKKEKNPIFMGFELEVEAPEFTLHQAITEINIFLLKNGLIDYFYFKEDLSLEEGFEIVSFPATFRYIKRYFKLKKFLSLLSSLVEVTYTCGFHIHIPQDTLNLQELAALQYFAYINRLELFYLSGRSLRSLKINLLKETPSLNKIKNLLTKNNYYQYKHISKEDIKCKKPVVDKYSAIALRMHTIEFRLFGGTLDYIQTMFNFNLVLNLIAYVKKMKPEGIVRRPQFRYFKNFVMKEKKQEIPLLNINKYLRRVLCGAHIC